jgi:hypothetical protein
MIKIKGGKSRPPFYQTKIHQMNDKITRKGKVKLN